MFLYYILQCATVVFLVTNSLNTQEDLQALRSWLGKCPHLKGARQGVRLNISKRFWFHLSIEFVSVEISKFIGDVSDDAKLLQFLRGCKFSLERTKEKLDLYNSCRWKVTLSLSIVEKKKVLWSCTLSLSFPSEQAFLTGSSRGTRQRRSSRRFSASGKSKAFFIGTKSKSVFFDPTEKGAKLFLAQKYFLADGELDFTLMKVNCLLSQALSSTSWLWHSWKAGGPFKLLSFVSSVLLIIE